jgi:hypothetical protein
VGTNVSEVHADSIFTPEDGDCMFMETLVSTSMSKRRNHPYHSRRHFSTFLILVTSLSFKSREQKRRV